jgi:hypothetical protein
MSTTAGPIFVAASRAGSVSSRTLPLHAITKPFMQGREYFWQHEDWLLHALQHAPRLGGPSPVSSVIATRLPRAVRLAAARDEISGNTTFDEYRAGNSNSLVGDIIGAAISVLLFPCDAPKFRRVTVAKAKSRRFLHKIFIKCIALPMLIRPVKMPPDRELPS